MAFPCAPWNSFIWLTMKHKEPHIACSRVPAYNPQVPQIIPQVPYWLAQHKDSIDGLTGCPEKAILKAIISINVNRSAKGILPLQVPLVVAHIVLVLIGLCDICTYEASGCVHCWSNDRRCRIGFRPSYRVSAVLPEACSSPTGRRLPDGKASWRGLM